MDADNKAGAITTARNSRVIRCAVLDISDPLNVSVNREHYSENILYRGNILSAQLAHGHWMCCCVLSSISPTPECVRSLSM